MEHSYFLPIYIELGGELYYKYPTGEIVAVPDNETEIPLGTKTSTSGEVEYDDNLMMAYYDNLNPFVERECEQCGDKIQKHTVIDNRNIYICGCGTIYKGNYLS